MRGNPDNLIQLYNLTRGWERAEGALYYGKQKHRLQQRADVSSLPLESVVAAFCALSPNNAEATNYRALDTCIGITTGKLSPDSRVIAYTPNKVKALTILRGAPVLDVLHGRKVTAFYHNTMNPDDSSHITVDGHMLGAWCGKRFALRREACIRGDKEYDQISKDFKEGAECFRVAAPKFQATLWLAWKRIHRILYSPQLKLGLEESQMGLTNGQPHSSRTSFRSEDGASITSAKATLSIPAGQQRLELKETPRLIELWQNDCWGVL